MISEYFWVWWQRVRRLKLGRHKEGVALASTPAIHFELGSLPTQACTTAPRHTEPHVQTCGVHIMQVWKGRRYLQHRAHYNERSRCVLLA